MSRTLRDIFRVVPDERNRGGSSGVVDAVVSRGVAWTSDPTWQGCIEACRAWRGQLRVLELAAGAGTASLALHLLLGQSRVQTVGAYDVDPVLRTVARILHGQLPDGCKFGAVEGDILRVEVEELPDADILVAGPPCPPWSSLGRRDSFGDVRAAVFWRVITIILHKASGGQLRAFVLENVEGLTHKVAGENRKPIDMILDELRTFLPSGWSVSWDIYNSLDYGVPQSRRRVYIRGVRVGSASVTLSAVSTFKARMSWDHILDVSASHSRRYTAIQTQNIADWKKAYTPYLASSKRVGQYAFVDVTRTPSGRTSWGGSVTPNVCPCLTASGPALHVFALGCGSGQLPVDRPLRACERACLQGFPEAFASAWLADADAVRIFGNAMTVPVVGSILASIIAYLAQVDQESVVSSAFDIPFAREQVPDAASYPEVEGQPAHPLSGPAGTEASVQQDPRHNTV